MASEVVPVKRLKRGNVATSKEGEIVVKEEIKEEIEDDICAVVQRELFNDAQYDQNDQSETDNSYLAGNLVQVTIKEEEEDGEVTTAISNQPTKPNPFKCRLCLATFSDSQTTLKHIRGHSRGKSHTCLTCHQTFKSLTKLTHHQQQLNHHQQPLKPSSVVFHCEVCCKTFPNQELLIPHQRSHPELHPELYPSIPCTFCGLLFSSESDLKVHLAVHTNGILPELSPINGKTLPPLAKRRLPQVPRKRPLPGKPPEPKTFQCTDCSSAYVHNRNLQQHIREKHPPPGTSVQIPKGSLFCVLCEVGKSPRFRFRSALVRHERVVHSGERPWKCTLCPFETSRRNSLVKHLKTHTGEQYGTPMPCHLCPRTFTDRRRLGKHLKGDHEGKSPWKCRLCGKLYGSKIGVRRHCKQAHQGGATVQDDDEEEED